MPPPATIFDTLICGFGLSSFILHLLAVSYHQFRPKTSGRCFAFNAAFKHYRFICT
jgi:hypothetical protein